MKIEINFKFVEVMTTLIEVVIKLIKAVTILYIVINCNF
jgi:hypothetical protein